MNTFELLCEFKNYLTPIDFDDLLKQLYTNDPSTYFEQVSNVLSRCHGIPEKVDMFLQYITDPNYAMEVSRISTQFDLLQQAQQLLPASEFTRFVNCFEFGRLDATPLTVKDNLVKWKQLVSSPISQKLKILLEQQFGSLDIDDHGIEVFLQQQTSYPTSYQFAPGMNSLMQQVYNALHRDESLYHQFVAILDADQMNGLPFPDSIMHIYEWTQNVDSDLWYPLAPVLEQMQTLQESESNQYESYEDFVQKNFLDEDGQDYLDGEIEQAKVQHLFGNMSM